MKLPFINTLELYCVVYPSETHSEQFHCYIVRKDKEAITVDSYIGVKYLHKIKEELNEIPVILVVFGSNVIYTSNKSMYESVLDDFYISTYTTTSASIDELYALSRTEYIEQLKSHIIATKLNLVRISLGVFPINRLYRNEFTEKNIRLDTVELQYDEIDCIHVQSSDNESLVNHIENLVLGVVLEYSTQSDKIDSNVSFESLEKNRLESRDKRVMEQVFKYGFPILFILVSIFYVVGLFLTHKNTQNVLVKNSIVSQERKMSSLRQELNQKEDLITALGLLRKHPYMYYINEIIKVLPSSIKLSELEVAPIIKTVQEKKKVLMDKNMVLIKGRLEDQKSLSQWIEEIQNIKDVKEVRIEKFENRKKETDFELVIRLQ